MLRPVPGPGGAERCGRQLSKWERACGEEATSRLAVLEKKKLERRVESIGGAELRRARRAGGSRRRSRSNAATKQKQ